MVNNVKWLFCWIRPDQSKMQLSSFFNPCSKSNIYHFLKSIDLHERLLILGLHRRLALRALMMSGRRNDQVVPQKQITKSMIWTYDIFIYCCSCPNEQLNWDPENVFTFSLKCQIVNVNLGLTLSRDYREGGNVEILALKMLILLWRMNKWQLCHW